MERICVTGSEGLVGSALVQALERQGYAVNRLDVRLPDGDPGSGSVVDADAVRRQVDDCDGIIHLAALSRVVWGERDPEGCWATNVTGTRNVVEAAAASPRRPWILFSSSREVYGQPARLPVREDAPLAPLNIYGRSKVAGEELMGEARRSGLRAAVVRLSNVYESTSDHDDRVIPAFARAAAQGAPMRVDGRDHTFDFTHLDDTVRGLLALTQALRAGERELPPIHLAAGHATTLGELAEIANRMGGCRSTIVEAPPRSYDVATFVGDPGRAAELLNWRAAIAVEDGVRMLVEQFMRELNVSPALPP